MTPNIQKPLLSAAEQSKLMEEEYGTEEIEETEEVYQAEKAILEESWEQLYEENYMSPFK